MQLNYGAIAAVVVLVVGVWLIVTQLRRGVTRQQQSEASENFKNDLPIVPRGQRQNLIVQDQSVESDNDALKHMADAAASASEHTEQSASDEDVCTPVSLKGTSQQLEGLDQDLPDESPVINQYVQTQQNQDSQSKSSNDIASDPEGFFTILLYPRDASEYISSSKILDLANEYKLRYGAHQMLYYYNPDKDSCLPEDLWFRMLAVDQQGALGGFVLHAPEPVKYQGLYFFVQKSDANALKGFDSMKIISKFLAEKLDAILCNSAGCELKESDLAIAREEIKSYTTQY